MVVAVAASRSPPRSSGSVLTAGVGRRHGRNWDLPLALRRGDGGGRGRAAARCRGALARCLVRARPFAARAERRRGAAGVGLPARTVRALGAGRRGGLGAAGRRPCGRGGRGLHAAAAVLLRGVDLVTFGRGFAPPLRGLAEHPPPLAAAASRPWRALYVPEAAGDDIHLELSARAVAGDLLALRPYTGNLWGIGYALEDDYDLMATRWSEVAMRVLRGVAAAEPRARTAPRCLEHRRDGATSCRSRSGSNGSSAASPHLPASCSQTPSCCRAAFPGACGFFPGFTAALAETRRAGFDLRDRDSCVGRNPLPRQGQFRSQRHGRVGGGAGGAAAAALSSRPRRRSSSSPPPSIRVGRHRRGGGGADLRHGPGPARRRPAAGGAHAGAALPDRWVAEGPGSPSSASCWRPPAPSWGGGRRRRTIPSSNQARRRPWAARTACRAGDGCRPSKAGAAHHEHAGDWLRPPRRRSDDRQPMAALGDRGCGGVMVLSMLFAVAWG